MSNEFLDFHKVSKILKPDQASYKHLQQIYAIMEIQTELNMRRWYNLHKTYSIS